MHPSIRAIAVAATLAVASACGSDRPLGPDADFRVAASPAHALSVLTWNIYLGADDEPVIQALLSPDPSDDFPALMAALQTLEATAFPVRAGAIAEEIARRRPHVVGLQEVSEIDINLAALGLPIVVNLDFLQILTAELAARGLNYSVAAANTTINVEPIPGVRITDHDVILVDQNRVGVLSSNAAVFAANIGVVAPGVELKRGWASVEAEVAGTTYLIATTHLESGSGPLLSGLRALQASELLAVFGAAPRVILMGDLNDQPGTPMHQVLLSGGFTDAWAALRPGVTGLTCCHSKDLSNPRATFYERIDYVMARGFGSNPAGLQGRIDILGDVPSDRVAGPQYRIWPSDHAGLAASLVVPPRP